MSHSVRARNDSSYDLQVVDIGESGVPASREFIGVVGSRVGDVNAYASSQDVREIEVTVTSEAAGTAELNSSILMVFDAPSDAIATTWLTEANHITDNTEIMAKVAVGETKLIKFKFGVHGIHLKRIDGSEALHVHIKAVSRG